MLGRQPTKDVFQSLPAGAQVGEWVALVGQPRGELRHQSRVGRCVDDVFVVPDPAGHHADAPGERSGVEVGAAVEADLVVAAAQLGERAVGDQVTLIEDDDAVGEALGFVELVGGQHDRTTAGRKTANDGADRVAAVHIHPRGGLVEEGHFRLRSHGQCQRDTLLLTAAEVPPGRRGAIGEADLLHERRWVGALAVQRAVVANGVEHASAGIHPALLQHHAHALAEFALSCAWVEAEDPHAAGGGTAVALAHFDRAGLAGAVGAEHRGDLARSGAERDVVHRFQLAVANRQTAHLHRCHAADATAVVGRPWGSPQTPYGRTARSH